MTEALSKLNFRDVGGLPADGGLQVRRGLILRSEGPASFDIDHHRELKALNIRLVCDLRSETEREAAPNDWCGSDCRLFHLDMNTDLRASGNEGWTALKNDPSEHGARSAMLVNYRDMPRALLPHLHLLIEAIIAGEMPMLVHCTAGKDRTGVTIAVLLLALGVSREDVVRDYLRSDVFADNVQMAKAAAHSFEEHFGFEANPAIVRMMVGVNADFLNAAMDVIDEEWGSIERYFAAGGVDVARFNQFREALLTN